MKQKDEFTGGTINTTQQQEFDNSDITKNIMGLVGGVDIEMSKPNETQTDVVQGQGKILTEKKRSAKWY